MTRTAHGARITFFVPSFRPGGAERVMVTLAEGFAARGHGVDVIVAQDEGHHAPRPVEGLRVVDLHASRVISSVPGLSRYLRRESPRALLSALPHANVVAVFARALAGARTRLVLSEHTTASVSAAQAIHHRARLLPHVMRHAYPRADAIVAVSEGAAEDLATFLRLDRARIIVIHNPVVSPRLATLAAQPLDHPWFAAGEPPVVLGAGRLSAAKDFPTLLRAFAALRARRRARLVILGEGEEGARLEALAAVLGVSADVGFPGYVDNPWRYMRRAAVFALSSRWEGFGNALVEAMACGAAVVATDCPHGPREILEGGRHGLLVPPGDVAALAAALESQIDRPSGTGAAARAESFSVESALDSYARVLGL